MAGAPAIFRGMLVISIEKYLVSDILRAAAAQVSLRLKGLLPPLWSVEVRLVKEGGKVVDKISLYLDQRAPGRTDDSHLPKKSENFDLLAESSRLERKYRSK